MSDYNDPLDSAIDCPVCEEPLNGSTCRNPDCGYRENTDVVECTMCGETTLKEDAESIKAQTERLGVPYVTKWVCKSHMVGD